MRTHHTTPQNIRPHLHTPGIEWFLRGPPKSSFDPGMRNSDSMCVSIVLFVTVSTGVICCIPPAKKKKNKKNKKKNNTKTKKQKKQKKPPQKHKKHKKHKIQKINQIQKQQQKQKQKIQIQKKLKSK